MPININSTSIERTSFLPASGEATPSRRIVSERTLSSGNVLASRCPAGERYQINPTMIQEWPNVTELPPLKDMMRPVIGMTWITRAAQFLLEGNFEACVAPSARRATASAERRMVTKTIMVATAARMCTTKTRS